MLAVWQEPSRGFLRTPMGGLLALSSGHADLDEQLHLPDRPDAVLVGFLGL